ncbi:MAG TPA: nuclear transport factor 2 family protein [Thermoleophilaceae bacterium]|nr:nuclear transport factor 2 family protein [Thermoleophilaceae bacterium]
MSQENVELIRQTLEAFLERGATSWDYMHEDIRVHDHDIPEHGDYTGHAGFRAWLREWGEAWSDWSLEPERYLDAGDSVVVIARLRATGRSSGVPVDRQDALVYRFRGEKVAQIDYYNNAAEALASVGLASS